MITQLRSQTLVTGPASEAFLLEDVKDHLQIVGSDDDDAKIDAWIIAVRKRAERFMSRALITQTWDFRYDGFPSVLEIPISPVQSVTSINYVDDAGNTQLLDSANYTSDLYAEPARIEPAYSMSWPTTRDVFNAVTVRAVCGYGDNPADVDEEIRQACFTLIASYDAHRGDEKANAELPLAWQQIMWAHRVNV